MLRLLWGTGWLVSDYLGRESGPVVKIYSYSLLSLKDLVVEPICRELHPEHW